MGRGVAFVPPLVHSERNPHNTMRDFLDEDQLYRQAGPLVDFLLHWVWKDDANDDAWNQLSVDHVPR